MRYIILCDKSNPMHLFAAEQMCAAAKQSGGNAAIESVDQPGLSEGGTEGRTVGDVRIVLTTLASRMIDQTMREGRIRPVSELRPQGYAVRRERLRSESTTRQDGYSKAGEMWWLIGADDAGAMYGGLDLADAIRTGQKLNRFGEVEKHPHVDRRGIKFNIPLDARTPSYSDNSDSAQQNIAEMWNFDFWREFLDRMALHRYNVLSLWNLHPFPSMVQVPEYPEIALDDVMRTTAPIHATTRGLYMSTPETLKHLTLVKKMTIEQKVTFWREVMQYARDRGIEVMVITWNIFTYGTEGNRYGIDERQDNETTIDYFRASVRAMLRTYPLLAGIGVTAGENMQRLDSPYSDEQWLWRTYGEAVRDVKQEQPERSVRFVHRAHWTSLGTIEEEFRAYPDTLDYSYKYSQAHMYSSERPPFIDHESFLDELPPGRRTWLTVRNDDYYMFRWGDPAFARQYILNMPASDRLAGFFMGPDGYIWGREFISRNEESASQRQTVIDKMAYMFAIWGKLAYDPTVPDDHFQQWLAARFPEISASLLYEAWASASRILPLVTTFHWEGNSLDFQWYPEACYSLPGRAKGFHTVRHFVEDGPMPESGLLSIAEYCEWRSRAEQANDNKTEQMPVIAGVSPYRLADDVEGLAQRTLDLLADASGRSTVAALREQAQPFSHFQDNELRSTLADLESMAWLGQYYAHKIRGAVELGMLQANRDEKHRELAVEHLKQAAETWKTYASKTSRRYMPQLLNRQGFEPVDLMKLQEEVEQDIVIAQQWKINSSSQ